MKRSDSKDSDGGGELWECLSCTFKNHPKIIACEICGSVKADIKE